jgi:hypothetical protein
LPVQDPGLAQRAGQGVNLLRPFSARHAREVEANVGRVRLVQRQVITAASVADALVSSPVTVTPRSLTTTPWPALAKPMPPPPVTITPPRIAGCLFKKSSVRATDFVLF